MSCLFGHRRSRSSKGGDGATAPALTPVGPPHIGPGFNAVVLGAGGVGKSCLTAQYVHQQWLGQYDPTIQDSYRKEVVINPTRKVMLEILDTAGTEQFGALRTASMETGQGFMFVFSINSKSSLDEVVKLYKELRYIKPDERLPIVLVGNKSDLVTQREVSHAQASELAANWKTNYYEVSARLNEKVEEPFNYLARQVTECDDIAWARAISGDDPTTPRSARRKWRFRWFRKGKNSKNGKNGNNM